MGLLSYLRGSDITDSTESRALPAPENEPPLMGVYTASPITPIAALAIADVWAAERQVGDPRWLRGRADIGGGADHLDGARATCLHLTG